VIDQYQVSTDKRSGITSAPTQPTDDSKHIVRLRHGMGPMFHIAEI
jgi:predicted helicase